MRILVVPWICAQIRMPSLATDVILLRLTSGDVVPAQRADPGALVARIP